MYQHNVGRGAHAACMPVHTTCKPHLHHRYYDASPDRPIRVVRNTFLPYPLREASNRTVKSQRACEKHRRTLHEGVFDTSTNVFTTVPTVGEIPWDALNAKYDGAAVVGGNMYFGPCHRNNVGVLSDVA